MEYVQMYLAVLVRKEGRSTADTHNAVVERLETSDVRLVSVLHSVESDDTGAEQFMESIERRFE